ncbi:hypothetical protein PG989_011015 [Apiospora arundinis]
MSATPSIMVPGGIRRKPVPEAQKRPPSPEVYDLLDDYYSEGDSNPPPYSLVEQPREDPRYNVQHRDNVRYQAQDREDSRYQDRPRPPTKAATIPLVIPTVNHFPPPPPPPQASPTPTPTWPPAGSPNSNAAATTVHYFPPPPPPGPPDTNINLDANGTNPAFQGIDQFIKSAIGLWISATSTTSGAPPHQDLRGRRHHTHCTPRRRRIH